MEFYLFNKQFLETQLPHHAKTKTAIWYHIKWSLHTISWGDLSSNCTMAETSELSIALHWHFRGFSSWDAWKPFIKYEIIRQTNQFLWEILFINPTASHAKLQELNRSWTSPGFRMIDWSQVMVQLMACVYHSQVCLSYKATCEARQLAKKFDTKSTIGSGTFLTRVPSRNLTNIPPFAKGNHRLKSAFFHREYLNIS